MNVAQKNKLKEYIGQDALVSIYTDISEPDYFDLGFVLALDDDYVLLNTVSQFGEETGFLLNNLDNIFLVCYDLPYAEKMQKLFQLKKQNRRDIPKATDDLLMRILTYAKENHRLIQVNNDDDAIGYVSDYQNQMLELQLVGCYGEDRGSAYIDFDTINIVDIDTIFLTDLMLLRDEKY